MIRHATQLPNEFDGIEPRAPSSASPMLRIPMEDR